MTRNVAIKLLATMAAAVTGIGKIPAQEPVEDQNNPPADAIQVATSTGAAWMTYSKDLSLLLDETTKIHVHKGGETVTITAEEVWKALQSAEYTIMDHLHGQSGSVIKEPK